MKRAEIKRFIASQLENERWWLQNEAKHMESAEWSRKNAENCRTDVEFYREKLERESGE